LGKKKKKRKEKKECERTSRNMCRRMGQTVGLLTKIGGPGKKNGWEGVLGRRNASFRKKAAANRCVRTHGG